MTLFVEAPNGRCPERDYILDVLLGDFLGLSWRREVSERQEVRITLDGQPGEIQLPDILFSVADADWLTEPSMPRRPLARWDTRDFAKDITLVEPTVPVIYGFPPKSVGAQQIGPANAGVGSTSDSEGYPYAGKETFAVLDDGRVTLPIDIFGSAFFMLSRYEELVTPDRDEHDRFPAWASLAYKVGFLERPIVDEYVEILWWAMKRLWPRLERKKHQFQMRVSCDVDHPFTFDGSLKRCVRRVGGDFLNRRSPTAAANSVVGSWQARRGQYHRDPFRNGIELIVELNEKAGRSVAFYFIPEKTDAGKDQSPSLDEPRMRSLLREIHARGHEVGIHPGYNTYRSSEAMRRSVNTLRRVLDEEGIIQPLLGGRQHYLRWHTSETARLWEECGLDYDSTLGFADHAGFRCGTCREFPLYDLQQRRPLRLRERPLILMECSVLAERYMGVTDANQALSVMSDLRANCERFGGVFTLLWHNSELLTQRQKKIYSEVIT